MQLQNDERVLFTKEMKRDYTILVPTMLPVHFKLMLNILREYGYRAELLENSGQRVVDSGLRNVHNDTCYPALLVIGQMIDALESGRWDVHKVALLITQTGGGCRASNYIHLLRKALKKSGYEMCIRDRESTGPAEWRPMGVAACSGSGSVRLCARRWSWPLRRPRWFCAPRSICAV